MRTITAYEELLLETLCFDLTIEHPHHFLLSGAESLQAADTTMGWAWSIVNDTYVLFLDIRTVQLFRFKLDRISTSTLSC